MLLIPSAGSNDVESPKQQLWISLYAPFAESYGSLRRKSNHSVFFSEGVYIYVLLDHRTRDLICNFLGFVSIHILLRYKSSYNTARRWIRTEGIVGILVSTLLPRLCRFISNIPRRRVRSPLMFTPFHEDLLYCQVS